MRTDDLSFGVGSVRSPELTRSGYLLQFAIENGPFIADLPIKNHL